MYRTLSGWNDLFWLDRKLLADVRVAAEMACRLVEILVIRLVSAIHGLQLLRLIVFLLSLAF